MAAMVVRTIYRAIGLTSLLWAVIGLAEARADVEALPLRTTVSVGRPAQPVQLRVEPRADGHVRIVATRGRRRAEADIPVHASATVQVQTVALRGGAQVAVVRLAGTGAERVAALITAERHRGPAIPWWGRLDLHGDPGERKADVLEVDDRTGDGSLDVVVGRTRESTRICGQERTLLFPRAVDPQTLTLRPVVLRRLPENPAAGERRLRAQRESPGPTGPPLLDRLVFTAASSVTGAAEEPALVPAPVALVDGDTSTVWLEGHGGDGKWEFVTARFDGGRFPIRAIAVTPTSSDPQVAEGLGRPLSFWLVGNEGPRLQVTLPEDPLAHPGEPYWVVPERPLHWRCLSLVLGEVAAPEGAKPGTVRAGVAQVRVYTDLDFGEGVQTLVEGLGTPGAPGAESAGLLASVGPRGVAALEKAWSDLGPLARQRAVRTLGAHATESDQARSLLVRAAGDPEPRVREAALAALEGAGSAAAGALAVLAKRPGPTGERAVTRLAALDPVAATEVLLAQLATEGGADRPALRRALARALRDGEAKARAHLEAWGERRPSPAAAAAAILAAAPVEAAHPIVAALFAATVPRVERFEDRWRLIQAAGHLPASDAVDAWLLEVGAHAEEWMLRAAALAQLAERGAGWPPHVTSAAFEDPYPRVRMAALEAFGTAREHLVTVATLARRDPWPMVRAAATVALGHHPRARPVLHAAVRDPSAPVRASAIGVLTDLGDSSAWPRIGERLADPREVTAVVVAASEHARRLCIAEAAAPLAERLERALAPDASDEDADLGLAAVRALAALGGAEADAALGRALSPVAPAHLQDAARRARSRETHCQ